MHGAMNVTRKNPRRVGVPATIKGRSNPEYLRSVFDGPTAERLAKAQGSFTIGDDKQGTRVYHFHDDNLDRFYSRLVKAAKRDNAECDRLRREYAALVKYRHHFRLAGKEATIGSVDLNRIFVSDPATRQGMPMSDGQTHHDRQWRSARNVLGHRCGIVVDNVVCHENPLEWAGFAIGYSSVLRARLAAEKYLREAGSMLARFWGID